MLLQVLRAVTSAVSGEEYSIIPKVRLDWMIVHVDAYSAGKRGSHSPLTTSNSDWLLQGKSPIRELPLSSSLIPLTEERTGRTEPGDPHIQNSEFPLCVCVFVLVCACVSLCVVTSGISGFV